jgi:hypothetical protein
VVPEGERPVSDDNFDPDTGEIIGRNDPAPPVHEDGVWFDLDADTYHRDHALGSSDMRDLARNPTSWWFRSKYNRHRPAEPKSDSRTFGSAVHKIVLEGYDAFAALYAAAEHNGNTAEGRKERKAIRDSGKTCITTEQWERAVLAEAYIKADPELAEAFVAGRSEVSIFWTRDGVRRKARFDYLKTRSIVDLKSIREPTDEELDAHCERTIAKSRYYVQFAHYTEAREHMAEFVGAGAVRGDHDAEWLRRVADTPAHNGSNSPSKSWFWTWVFFQNSGSPETFGVYSHRGRKLFDQGVSQIILAEYNWKEGVEKYGLTGTPWIKRRKLGLYDEDSQPEWVWR